MTIDPGLPLVAVVVEAAPVQPGPARESLHAEIAELARVHHEEPTAADLQPARALYRAFGIDPTKTRPSSEALLRRLRRGEGLPAILDAVDLANLLAVRFLLPIGLYDAGRITPPVRIRRGLSGESYPGIRKDAVHLEGRPVVADAGGPFGNPTSDSARTAVTPDARALLLVVFAPRDLADERLDAHRTATEKAMRRHLAGPGGAAVETVGRIVRP